jgi:hypothetical protein
MDERICTGCGGPESEHVLSIVNDNFIARRTYDIVRAHLCPGQLEDIDTFEPGDEEEDAT